MQSLNSIETAAEHVLAGRGRKADRAVENGGYGQPARRRYQAASARAQFEANARLHDSTAASFRRCARVAKAGSCSAPRRGSIAATYRGADSASKFAVQAWLYVAHGLPAPASMWR